MAVRIITFGTFDVFHIGHIKILERARSLGDYLIVGVSSDKLNFKKKTDTLYIIKTIELILYHH